MRVLVRDFIHRALYDAKVGYFAARNVVGTLMSPLNFRSLLGRPEVEAKLAKSLLSVEGNAEAWLTPAEVFAPYFSQAVASYIVKQFRARQKKVPGQLRQLGKKRSGKKRRSHRNGAGAQQVVSSSPELLRIIEIGAGSGTNAVLMLNYLRDAHGDLYKRTQLTIVEISELLAEKYRTRLAGAGHGGVSRVVVGDACDLEAAGVGSKTPGTCFVVALEVLDNLPHDKVVHMPIAEDSNNTDSSPAGMAAPWHETVVSPRAEQLDDPYMSASAGRHAREGGGREGQGAAYSHALTGDTNTGDTLDGSTDRDNGTPTEASSAPASPSPSCQPHDPYSSTSPGWARAPLQTTGTLGWIEHTRPVQDQYVARAVRLATSSPPPEHSWSDGSPATTASAGQHQQQQGGGGEQERKPFAAALSDAVEGVQRGLASLLYTEEERELPGRTGKDVVLVTEGPGGVLRRTRLPSSGSSVGGEREDGPAWTRASRMGAQRMQLVEFGGEMGALTASELEPLCLRTEAGQAASGEEPTAVFVPSGALRLFESLHRALPGHCLIAADFNALPDPTPTKGAASWARGDGGDGPTGTGEVEGAAPEDEYIPARNPPIVSSIRPETGANEDHEDYLRARPFGCADIFFASDFALLAEAWCGAALEARDRASSTSSSAGSTATGGNTGTDTPDSPAPAVTRPVAQVARTRDFLDTHSDLDKMRTVTGYNPAVSMYGNTRILFGRQ